MSLIDEKEQFGYLSDLASNCQGTARCLTYNDDETQSRAKHLLLEAAHALDSMSIRVHRKRDGLMMVTARGNSRFMTMRERVAFWLLGNRTEMKP